MTPPQAALATAADKPSRKSRRTARKQKGASDTAEVVLFSQYNPETREALAKAEKLYSKDRFGEAAEIANAALETFPDCADCWLLLGLCCENLKNKNGAYHCYKKALELAPENGNAWLFFGRMLLESHRPKASQLAFEQCLSRDPDSIEGMKLLALALLNLGESQRGLEVCEAALEREPDWANGYYIKGVLHKSEGDMQQSREAFVKGNELDPNFIDMLHGLADISKGPDLEDILVRLEKVDPKTLDDPKRQSDLYFVSGRTHRGLNRHEEAFESYRKGNDLLKDLHPFDTKDHEQKIDALISAFTPDVFTSGSRGSDSRRPVFIVGMPRSGSTLTERIILSHSATDGVGESRAMIEIVDALYDVQTCPLTYPKDVGKIDANGLGLLADQYLTTISQECSGEAERVVDKMLFNYVNLGLIALLFPNAKIIHCKRNPLDTCTSCYFVRFTNVKGLSFTTDLEALGFYYRQYARLMAHWREALPIPMLEVQYENLIEDQEGESRRIIDFLGLEWEDACLDFQSSKKSVRTASSVQVRQPIYKTSAGRWKHYEEQLAPLRHALGDLVTGEA